MAVITLKTYICDDFAGYLHQNETGLISFRYDSDYQGIPLSLRIPVANREYGQEVARPYLFGLLPDSEQQRRAIALEYGVSPNNPVALLTHIGLDCPGGVQFCKDEAELSGRDAQYRPLSEHEIALKLKTLREDRNATWMGENESWSLGGNQGKFALYSHNSSWCECLGAAPTTHIFKNGVSGFMLEALNEFACMKTARFCDVPTADVYYLLFEDEPALIVERYDRLIGDKGVSRLHQEDMCQALGCMPNQKYTSDGGPRASDILRLLARTSHSVLNLQNFTKMLFYNSLIGAPDAHAKNYSLLLGANATAMIAPMYDVASGLAYDNLRRKGRLAMSIGGENRFGRVGRGAIERYAGGNDPELREVLEASGLTAEVCVEIMAELAEIIPHEMELTFEEYSDLDGMDELREHMLGPVTENCKATLEQL